MLKFEQLLIMGFPDSKAKTQQPKYGAIRLKVDPDSQDRRGQNWGVGGTDCFSVTHTLGIIGTKNTDLRFYNFSKRKARKSNSLGEGVQA